MSEARVLSPPTNRLAVKIRFVWPVLRSTGVYLRTMAVVVVIWWFVAEKIANPLILPRPQGVFESIVRQLDDGSLLNNLGSSVWRLFVAYLISLAIGLPIGVLIGWTSRGDWMLTPLVEVLRPISSIAWIPLALVTIGVGNGLPIFILIYVSIFPVILNTVAGVRSVGPTLLNAGRSMGVGRLGLLLHIVLPAALPTIITGVRLSLGLGWMALIASELVGAPSGLGYSIQFYAGLFRSEDMIAVVVTIAVLGYLTDLLIRLVERVLTPWAMS